MSGIVMEQIDTRSIHRELFNRTLNVLRSLDSEGFDKETILESWLVRDIVTHLASNSLQKTSAVRDFIQNNREQIIADDFDKLSKLIDENNYKWVNMLRDLEPGTLVDFFCFAYGSLLDEFDIIPDLLAPAVHNVSWAHSSISPWWLDMAREYTELWIHSQQIFDSLEVEGILDDDFFGPFADTCFYASERHFEKFTGPFSLGVFMDHIFWEIKKANGIVSVQRDPLFSENDALISLTRDTGWKLFAGLLSETQLPSLVAISGDKDLCQHFLAMKCVMI